MAFDDIDSMKKHMTAYKTIDDMYTGSPEA